LARELEGETRGIAHFEQSIRSFGYPATIDAETADHRMSPAGTAPQPRSFTAASGIAHETPSYLTAFGKSHNPLCLAECAYDLLGWNGLAHKWICWALTRGQGELSSMENRTGVFICECGPNIKNLIDIAELYRRVRHSEAVVMAAIVPFCCSADGQALIAEETVKHGLDRVVIAACSPLEHEHTFNGVLVEAGLNPFLLQMVNIREQCAWVTPDVREATAKAITLVQAAIARVEFHRPLVAGEIECQADVLVVGAGIAGISAALTLAQKQRQVYLVEKSPSIGGKASRFQHMFPDLQCTSCLFAEEFDEVMHSEQIQLFTLSRVQSVAGYWGNFQVELRQEDRGVDLNACVGCGLCQEACPVSVPDEPREGFKQRRAIFIPYAGALPQVAVIDWNHCLRSQGYACDACQAACPYAAVRYDDGHHSHQIKVGAIVLATGCGLFDPSRAPQYGYGTVPNVITGMELEHLLDSDGPTAGKILKIDGQPPDTIALVHCVGSRSEAFHEYCSGICCRLSLKYAARVLEDLPEARVALLHSDLCLPGKDSQLLLADLSRNNRVRFLRMAAPDALQVVEQGDSASIRYRDDRGYAQTLTTDLVVLLTAMEGARDGAELAVLFDIEQDEDGFFMAARRHSDPLASTREGIILAGCAMIPGDIPTAVAQGQAAAGKILSQLMPGETLPLPAVTAEILPERCSRCGRCQASCPSSAIDCFAMDTSPSVNKVLCSGCGACAVACPSGAICLHHYTDEQLTAELSILVGDSEGRVPHGTPRV
jgi:heterodisulfide reductase subunit A2